MADTNQSKKTVKPRPGALAKKIKLVKRRVKVPPKTTGPQARATLKFRDKGGPLLIIVEHSEFQEAVERAIAKARRRNADGTYSIDRDRAVAEVMAVAKKFNRRKRGPRPDERLNRARDIFLEELKQVRVSLDVFKGWSTARREDFWN